jgi:two-component system sensor histidine kinase TctE
MLREAILNLLTNTSTHGGPDMTAVDLSLSVQKETAVLTVTDNGAGIPADKHVEAISRFGQAGGGPGSGLGLPIALRVMENHGGSLEILDCDTGTSIRLSLPLVKGTKDP